MTSLTNLLVFDVSSYGSALAIINQFCDDKDVKVFEVSPVGPAAILILLVGDAIAGELLHNEIVSFFKSSILNSIRLKNLDIEILKIYLSQNKPEVLSNVLVQEFSFVSEAFGASQFLRNSDISVIEFRLIRTFPTNAILVSTSNDVSKLIKIKN